MALERHSSGDLDPGAVARANSNVQVVVRVRPPNDRENDLGYHKCIAVDPSTKLLQLLTRPQPKPFSFDYIADEDKRQEEIFATVGKPITDACLEGYHCCLLAYGQTGAGKTFTMEGPDGESDGDGAQSSTDKRGLIPRILQYIFRKLSADRELQMLEFTIRCSYLQIYNEQVSDLLEPDSMNLNVREDLRHGMFVEGLQEVVVSTAEATYALFKRGSQNRRVGQTAMNMESSRSHSVFTIVVETQRRDDAGVMNRRTSRFNLVDLAGSERQKHSEAQGVRLKEAGSINKSLSALGNVIKALVDIAEGKVRHVPYRDSKLTFLLSDSLGGNSKCTLLAAVSPAEKNIEETLSTLKFAQRAKLMHNEAVVNELMMGNPAVMGEEIRRLRLEIAELRANATAGVPGQPLPPPSPSAAPMSDNQRICRLEHIISQSTKRALEAERQAAQEVAKQGKRAEAAEALAEGLVRSVQGLKMVVKLREERIGRLEGQGRCDGGCVRGEDAAAVQELSEEVEVLRRMVERNPDAIRFQLEVDVCKARISELEQQLQSDSSEADKVGALERLNNALREELKEAFDENETLRGEAEGLQRERDELRAKLVGMEEHVKKVAAVAEQYRQEVNNTRHLQRSVNERKHEFDDARVRCGVAEAKVSKLLQQLAAAQQVESVLKVQAAEQDAQRAALARELQACQAESARSAAEREKSTAEAAQLRADLEAVQKQVEALVEEKERIVEEGAEAAAAGREKERALEEQRKALEEALEGMKRMQVAMEDAGREKERALEAQKTALEEALEGMTRKQVETEEAARQKESELEEQRTALAEAVEAMKSKLVEMEEKVQALEKERELLWAAAEQGAGTSGDGDGADGAAGGSEKLAEMGERIAQLEEELRTERDRVIHLAEKVGDRDGLLEAACERQRRAEEAAERARREAEEYAAGGRTLQQVNLELEEKLCSALQSLQEAKERVEELERERVALMEQAIRLEKEMEEQQQQQQRQEEEEEEEEQQQREQDTEQWQKHVGGGSSGKRRWQEIVRGGEDAVERGGGEEEAFSPMTLCLSELRDVTNRASPLRATEKGASAADAGGKAGITGGPGSAPSPVQLGSAADTGAAVDMPALPASAAAFLSNRWTLPLAGDTTSVSTDTDNDPHRYTDTAGGGERAAHNALGRRLEKKKRRRSAPVSQTELQAEKLRLMEVQVRHMVKQLATAHADVKSLSGKMQKAGPVMVRMREVVQQLRAKGQALELALLQTVEREAEREQAEEDEKEEIGQICLQLGAEKVRLREERDAYFQQLMVVGPRNALLCEELSGVKKRLEVSREAMSEMEEERARLRSKLTRLSRKLQEQTGRKTDGVVKVEYAAEGKVEAVVKAESGADVGDAADVEDADEVVMADVDAALAVVREHVEEVESRNRQLAEQVRALEQQCERLQAEAEGLGGKMWPAVAKSERKQVGGNVSHIKREDAGEEDAGEEDAKHKVGGGSDGEQERGKPGLVRQLEELMARLAADEERARGMMGLIALAEQECSEMHARVAAVVARERALQKLLVSPLLRDAGAGDAGIGGRAVMGAGASEEVIEGWRVRWQQLEQEQGKLDVDLNLHRVENKPSKEEHAQDGCGQGGVEVGVEASDMGADIGQPADIGPQQRRMQVEEVRGAVAQVVLVESLLAVVLCRAGLAGLSSRIGSKLGASGGMGGEGGLELEDGSGAGAGKEEPGVGVVGSEKDEDTEQVTTVLNALQKQRVLLLGFLGVKADESSPGDRAQERLDGVSTLDQRPKNRPESVSQGKQINEQEREAEDLVAEGDVASPSEGLTLPPLAVVSRQVMIAQQLVRAGVDATMAHDDTCWLRGSVLRGVYTLKKLVAEVEGKVAGWEAQWGELEHTCQQQTREEREEEEAGRRQVVERTVSVAAEAVEIEKQMEERQQQLGVVEVGLSAGGMAAGVLRAVTKAGDEQEVGVLVAKGTAGSVHGGGEQISDAEREVESLLQLKEAKEREVVGLMKRVTEMEAQGKARWEEAMRRQEAAARQVEGLGQQLRAAQQQLSGKSAEADALVWKVEQLQEEVKAKDAQITSLHEQLAAAVKAVALDSPQKALEPSAAAAVAAPGSEPKRVRPSGLGHETEGSRRVRTRLRGVLSGLQSMANREGSTADRDSIRSPLLGKRARAAAAEHISSSAAACSGRAVSGSCGTGGGTAATGGEGEEFYTPMSHWSFSQEDVGYGGGPLDAAAATGGSVKGGKGKGSGWGVGLGGAGGGSAKKQGWRSGTAKCVGSDENTPLIPEGPLSGEAVITSAPLHTPPVGGSASKVTVRTTAEAPAPFSQLPRRWQVDRPLSGEGTPRSSCRGPVLR
ncbi:hypothetical protein CLOM_g3190 [Closterium sp. NIES-68]|nr:hypothetical protein CLOM_g3190 [Closterium sp. NIES-68]GJP76331.1 hypothetical protein CLOP_g6793 [Closterium sp. NIES-67]